MLELKNITKIYGSGNAQVEALKNVSVNFRDNEFVSILGASGCGKTTLLNIVGGLDKYTTGDLVIDGVSTKQFKDRDWDTYRNHKIGFVFQSYNLIHHLSILENVEMGLTLNGVSKKERKEMALDALKKVGLSEQVNKMPNQLSGGQMQRVAIARAIVNNPSIILADEPTGALDTKTSVQVMDILKEISKDKLIIMVTHNPKLAKKYSTRIIKLVDGKLHGDSMPFENSEFEKENTNSQKLTENLVETLEKQNSTNKIEKTETLSACDGTTSATENSKGKSNLQNNCNRTKTRKVAKDLKSFKNKTSMSFFTALYLSFKNLLHKKGRTFLTSFAGSIGIIGVALVLAISNGFTNYINSMQSDTLSGYPVTVSTATIDYSSFTSFESGGSSSNVADSDDYAYIYDSGLQQYIKYGHYNYISPNFVEKVKQLESEDSEKGANKELNLVQYNYFTPIKILVKNDDGSISLTANKNSLSILSGSAGSSFYEALSSEDFMMEQYETIYQIDDYDPDNIYNLTLVVSKGNKITSGLLKSLGITPEQNIDGSYKNISFEEICNREFKLVYNDEYYSYDAENDEFSVLDTTDQTALNDLFDGSQVKTLKIARVIRQKEDSDTSLLSSGVMYTSALAKEYRENCAESEIAQKQAERKEAESTAGSYSFYAPFVIDISEFSGMGMLPADGFKNTVEINYFLNNYFKLNIASNEAYELAMQQIGCSSIPQSISFYTKNFDAKKSVTNLIDDYNKTVDEAHQIIYTDQADFLTKTLGAMINIVSYVLIAFASISLVVSSIMIGIITYVSVIERTKEIGVLRSLGARKKDISRVFNAETLIIGFMAGFIGVVISYALCPIISLIVHNLASGISNIATLNPLHALILIVISMALTLISGSIPSKIASKKDPVECLRSE